MVHERFPPDFLVQPVSHRLAYFRAYTVAHPVLKDVDLAVKRALREPAGGSLVLVVGPTGVGKTTLRLRIEQHLRNTFMSAAKEDPGRIPVIGVETDTIIKRFLTGMPARFETAKGDPRLAAVVVDVNPETGRAGGIERMLLAEGDLERL